MESTSNHWNPMSKLLESQRTTQSVVGFTTEFVRGINHWNLTAQPESYKTVRTNQYYSIVKMYSICPVVVIDSHTLTNDYIEEGKLLHILNYYFKRTLKIFLK